jgi:hypothetical protein
VPSDRPAGDGNRDAYGERAETYLRLLAEDALRPSAGDALAPSAGDEPCPPAPAEAAAADRVYRAANLLVEAGAITDTQAAWILLDLATALRARGRPEPPPVPLGRIRRLATVRPKRSAVSRAEWRVLPGPAPVPGAHLMALILTPDRVLAPATLSFPPSAGIPDLQAMPWAGLTAADGAGTTYWITSATGSWAGSTWTGTILMRPAPPARAGWVKISSRNGFSLLIPISHAPPASAVPPEPVSDSPGERLLTRHAEAILASLPVGLPGNGGRFAPVEPGFPELTGTLEAAGALSALSPVSRQVAALHMLLGLPGGAGMSNGSLSDLPGRWLHVVTHYGRRRQLPPASGTATIGAGLPDLDGARFAVAGLHSGPAGTHLHVVARGLRPLPHRVPPGLEGDTGFSWWLRDDSGGWHLGAIEEAIPVAAETVLRMAMLPPLTHRTATLTAEVTGRSARITAALPVRW